LQEKIARDEESFRQIKEATGDDDIKMIKKFLVQSDN
jgi:hypothetical protein